METTTKYKNVDITVDDKSQLKGFPFRYSMSNVKVKTPRGIKTVSSASGPAVDQATALKLAQDFIDKNVVTA